MTKVDKGKGRERKKWRMGRLRGVEVRGRVQSSGVAEQVGVVAR